MRKLQLPPPPPVVNRFISTEGYGNIDGIDVSLANAKELHAEIKGGLPTDKGEWSLEPANTNLATIDANTGVITFSGIDYPGLLTICWTSSDTSIPPVKCHLFLYGKQVFPTVNKNPDEDEYKVGSTVQVSVMADGGGVPYLKGQFKMYPELGSIEWTKDSPTDCMVTVQKPGFAALMWFDMEDPSVHNDLQGYEGYYGATTIIPLYFVE